jgi:hypothetical protein
MQWRACLLGAGLAMSAAALSAQAPVEQLDLDDQDIVVHGTRPYLVVNGRPHCRPLQADPYDAVAAPLHHAQRMIAPSRDTGEPELRRDRDPITGPDVWQRAGTAIGAYVFRAPASGATLCIGARIDRPDGFGQLRQVLDAHPYRTKTIRFTAWVATSEVHEVRFWLAAGGMGHVLLGDDTRTMPVRGTHRWMPVSLTIGPVPRVAATISYGFLLEGKGDVWLARPRLEIIETPGVVDPPGAR